MIQVKIFGLENCSNETRLLEAANIEELMLKISEGLDVAQIDMLRSCAVIVNNEYIMNQDRVKTELKDGDDVLILSPIIGG
ncbi:MAG TPA: MoaD/ThiS family protein [Desulfosporosinus sp.]|jgi:sulfur carrier protein ThiS|nr:MoaD/ThiS family protein [Desulfosporosinus sp.]